MPLLNEEKNPLRAQKVAIITCFAIYKYNMICQPACTHYIYLFKVFLINWTKSFDV